MPTIIWCVFIFILYPMQHLQRKLIGVCNRWKCYIFYLEYLRFIIIIICIHIPTCFHDDDLRITLYAIHVGIISSSCTDECTSLWISPVTFSLSFSSNIFFFVLRSSYFYSCFSITLGSQHPIHLYHRWNWINPDATWFSNTPYIIDNHSQSSCPHASNGINPNCWSIWQSFVIFHWNFFNYSSQRLPDCNLKVTRVIFSWELKAIEKVKIPYVEGGPVFIIHIWFHAAWKK